MKKFNVGIIGYGWAASAHIAAINATSRGLVTAVCSTRPLDAAELSGGEQQRVALARAYVTEPALLLADEPTGSLDAATGTAVIDLMFRLNREHGTTLLLVMHDREIAARCARRLSLAAGRLVD